VRIPANEQGEKWEWVTRKESDTLLYFAQLMEELLNNQSSDGLRARSLDSYHRLREIERTWDEAHTAAVTISMSPLVEELKAYLSRDPIVTDEFSVVWTSILPRLSIESIESETG
jgi:hypothetical protein